MDNDFDGRIKDMIDSKGGKGFNLAAAFFAVLLVTLLSVVVYFAWTLVSNGYPPIMGEKQQEYLSKHGFSIRYPEEWRLDNSLIESFKTMAEAESTGSNHFDIYSYPEVNKYNPGDPVPRKELKIEAIVYNDITKAGSDWDSSFSNITKTEPFTVDGKPAKKIWQKWGDLYDTLSVVYTDGNKGAIFNCWPADSRYLDVFYRITSSFKFL